MPGEVDMLKPTSDVGGVVGGVIGSRAEGEGEERESSVRAVSAGSVLLEFADETLLRYWESLDVPLTLRAAERCDWCERRGERPR